MRKLEAEKEAKKQRLNELNIFSPSLSEATTACPACFSLQRQQGYYHVGEQTSPCVIMLAASELCEGSTALHYIFKPKVLLLRAAIRLKATKTRINEQERTGRTVSKLKLVVFLKKYNSFIAAFLRHICSFITVRVFFIVSLFPPMKGRVFSLYL